VASKRPAADPLRLGPDNTGAAFWGFVDLPDLAYDPVRVRLDAEVTAWLTEEAFGPHRYELGTSLRAYYLAKRFVPRHVRLSLRRRYERRAPGGPLGWPIEDGLVRLRQRQARAVLSAAGLQEAVCVDFWPSGHRCSLVVTHDVESKEGLSKVMKLARVDERHGLVSSFNFVPERYEVDEGLRRELVDMGCEVGVHGLKHDGLLFWSRRVFEARAVRINVALAEWGAVGFRAPLTHRQPEWMQALNIEYDSSFFDTDPFEPMPGGTGSIWPYFCGRFVELPYTLPQDSTLFELMAENGPEVWLGKLGFIAEHHGMALINVHPDYIFDGRRLSAYESLLSASREHGCWNALPREVAEWWRFRTHRSPDALVPDRGWDAREIVVRSVDNGRYRPQSEGGSITLSPR
jgi:peptidoglycan/xylan/chitin deacetylase (PgdA/CDA1 family)